MTNQIIKKKRGTKIKKIEGKQKKKKKGAEWKSKTLSGLSRCLTPEQY